MHRIEEVSTLSALKRYYDDWNALLSSSVTADFFHTYEWVTTWIESFWGERPLSFLFIWQENKLVSIAPFLNDEKGDLGCPRSLVTPINGEAKRTSIIFSGRLEIILKSIFEYLKKTRKAVRVSLKKAQKDSLLISTLAKIAKDHRLSTTMIEKSSSPLLRISQSWNSYLSSKSRHFRHELNRKSRLLEKAGKAEWVVITTQDHVQMAMENLFSIEKNSWKHQQGRSLVARPVVGRFYEEFARRSAEKGWLRMHFLFLNSRPIAYIYGLVFKNEYFALKTSYDEGYKPLSPGIVLFGHALRDAFEHRFSAFDFLGEESRWKNQYANDMRRHVDLCVFSRNDFSCWRCKFYHQDFKSFIRSKLPFVVSTKKRFEHFFSKGE